MCVYIPLSSTNTVPVIVSFKGTNEVWNVLQDIGLTTDHSQTQYLAVALESFFQRVHALSDMLSAQSSTIGTRDIQFVGHSLGALYALHVERYLTAQNSVLSQQITQVSGFNPFIVADSAWMSLKAADATIQSKYKWMIVDGDFASIIASTGEVGTVFHFQSNMSNEDWDPDGNGLDANTIREWLVNVLNITPTRTQYLDVVNHGMANWTEDKPTTMYETIVLNDGDNDREIKTSIIASLPQYGVTTPGPLYMARDATLNLHTMSNSSHLISTLSVTDATAFQIQTYTNALGQDELWINRNVLVEHIAGGMIALGTEYNGVDNLGRNLVRFKRLSDGQYLKVPTDDFDTMTLPVQLALSTTTQLQNDITAGYEELYDFIVVTTGDEVRRRTEKPGFVDAAIGFTFNSAIANYDTYDVDFALYDTGGGLLKWGHVDVGDRDNYKIQLPHKTGDEYYVHSNSYDAATATYTPSFEIVYYDTTRYTIRNTDVLNNGKYLKRPIPDDSLFTSTTSWMMHQNSSGYFIDMQWDAWDGLTGSPDDYLFEIESFDQLKIPARLGNVLTNYNADGTMVERTLMYPQYMKSADGVYTLTFQRDGNLALFSNTGAAIYTSGTFYAGNGLFLQIDGNVVIYDGGSKTTNVTGPVRWVTGTGGSAWLPNGYKIILYVTNTGKIVITDDQDNDLWST